MADAAGGVEGGAPPGTLPFADVPSPIDARSSLSARQCEVATVNTRPISRRPRCATLYVSRVTYGVA